jgi:hypothetical protein
MFEYNDAVADALATNAVGGSAACLAAVRDAFAAVGAALATAAGRAALADLFRVCGGEAALVTADNRRALLESLSDPLIPQVPGRGGGVIDEERGWGG